MEEKIPHTVSPLEKRVVKEKLDLDKKISALAAFLKGAKRTDLLRRDKRILEQQLDAMEVYSFLLDSRIKIFRR
jgi:hypothetical protein